LVIVSITNTALAGTVLKITHDCGRALVKVTLEKTHTAAHG